MPSPHKETIQQFKLGSCNFMYGMIKKNKQTCISLVGQINQKSISLYVFITQLLGLKAYTVLVKQSFYMSTKCIDYIEMWLFFCGRFP